MNCRQGCQYIPDCTLRGYDMMKIRLTIIGLILSTVLTSFVSEATECYIGYYGHMFCSSPSSQQVNIAPTNLYRSSRFGLQSLSQRQNTADQHKTLQASPYGYAITEFPRRESPHSTNAPYYPSMRTSTQYNPINSNPYQPHESHSFVYDAGDSDRLGIHLPRMRGDINVGYPYAEIKGALILQNGCIYLKPYGGDYPASSLYTVVWPPKTKLQQVRNNISVTENTVVKSVTSLGVPTSFTGGVGNKPFQHKPQIHQQSLHFKCKPYPSVMIGSWKPL